MERVITYVDGFNLYFGLQEKGWRRYLWLNIQELARNLLKPGQQLACTKYFTSRVSGPPAKQVRQSIFIDALETLDDFAIFYGRYQSDPYTCRSCQVTIRVPHEKMTDVNIAVEMMSDAFQDKFDTALLLSADADLVGPIKAIRRLFPAKRVVVAFPPKRYSDDLAQVANSSFVVGRRPIRDSRFPPSVTNRRGVALQCPVEWTEAYIQSLKMRQP
ncbi:MAG: NYN domain-containing protein [Chloroflexi bacterium]|nr:NYN domain-containing protein [Chloroflexota bacterium]